MTQVEPDRTRDPAGTARYIEHMARELKALAHDADLGFLTYLLSMVEADAAATARRLDRSA